MVRHFFINWQEFTPQSISCLREGYSRQQFFRDLFAGITIGIITLPLAMAFAIGAGVDPERGLYTAIVAGFIISLLGGSRFQIAGPTGAYIVIIYDIMQRHGYEGLAVATLLAGFLLIGMGIARLGLLLKFIPYPVTTGFTAGIAINIFSSQIKDFFGLAIDKVPASFLERWSLYLEQAASWSPWSLAIAGSTLLIIIALRWIYPKLPGAILAVIFLTLFTQLFDIPIETIQDRFGEIPRMLPKPAFPSFSFALIGKYLPDAINIALLGAIESLLSAHVADGIRGTRHRPNCELIAQGFGNIGSIFFGGIPATGAIARTGANVNLNAQTPLAGIIHAVTILLLLLLFAPLVSRIPMAGLSAVLIMVAWNMSERKHVKEILKGPVSDILVLILTLGLTVLVDLTLAVQGGLLLSALLFVKQMSETTTLHVFKALVDPLLKGAAENSLILEMKGPLFFAISHQLQEQLQTLPESVQELVLRMDEVPTIDASGIHTIKLFIQACQKRSIKLSIHGLRDTVYQALHKSGALAELKDVREFTGVIIQDQF